MANKRANHTGSIRYQEKKGLWEYRFTIPSAEGMSERKQTYGKTQKEAVSKGKALEEMYRKGLVAKKDGRTFTDFAKEWYERKTRARKAKNTLLNYQRELSYIEPILGEKKLQAIKPAHVRALIDALAEMDYAPRTQQKVIERLRMIFKEAMRLELIFKNPAEFITVEVPRTDPVGKALQPDQIERFLTAADGHSMGLFFRLVLGCGLRKGEALALTWADVDLEVGELSITKNWTGAGQGHLSAPKTKRSRRIVPIPTALLARVKAYHHHMLEDFPSQELKGLHLFGITKPLDTQSPNHALKRICEKHGLEPFRVHDLRHTYGSIMLASKIPLEVVSERLGHSNPTVTLNVYRHVLEFERRGYVFDVEDIINQKPNPAA